MKVSVNISLDSGIAENLRVIAKAKFEGNLSRAAEFIIKRGLGE